MFQRLLGLSQGKPGSRVREAAARLKIRATSLLAKINPNRVRSGRGVAALTVPEAMTLMAHFGDWRPFAWLGRIKRKAVAAREGALRSARGQAPARRGQRHSVGVAA